MALSCRVYVLNCVSGNFIVGSTFSSPHHTRSGASWMLSSLMYGWIASSYHKSCFFFSAVPGFTDCWPYALLLYVYRLM